MGAASRRPAPLEWIKRRGRAAEEGSAHAAPPPRRLASARAEATISPCHSEWSISMSSRAISSLTAVPAKLCAGVAMMSR